MCILLYGKLNWCSGFLEIYALLEKEGWGQSAMGICAFFSMSNLFGVVVFQRSMLNWRKGVHLPSVYVHSSICETYLVYWFSRDLCLIGGRGIHLPLVYVHSSICETYLV